MASPSTIASVQNQVRKLEILVVVLEELANRDCGTDLIIMWCEVLYNLHSVVKHVGSISDDMCHSAIRALMQTTAILMRYTSINAKKVCISRYAMWLMRHLIRASLVADTLHGVFMQHHVMLLDMMNNVESHFFADVANLLMVIILCRDTPPDISLRIKIEMIRFLTEHSNDAVDRQHPARQDLLRCPEIRTFIADILCTSDFLTEDVARWIIDDARRMRSFHDNLFEVWMTRCATGRRVVSTSTQSDDLLRRITSMYVSQRDQDNIVTLEPILRMQHLPLLLRLLRRLDDRSNAECAEGVASVMATMMQVVFARIDDMLCEFDGSLYDRRITASENDLMYVLRTMRTLRTDTWHNPEVTFGAVRLIRAALARGGDDIGPLMMSIARLLCEIRKSVSTLSEAAPHVVVLRASLNAEGWESAACMTLTDMIHELAERWSEHDVAAFIATQATWLVCLWNKYADYELRTACIRRLETLCDSSSRTNDANDILNVVRVVLSRDTDAIVVDTDKKARVESSDRQVRSAFERVASDLRVLRHLSRSYCCFNALGGCQHLDAKLRSTTQKCPCGQVFFCSRECQLACWKVHKYECTARERKLKDAQKKLDDVRIIHNDEQQQRQL